jgi:hypothetical protein
MACCPVWGKQRTYSICTTKKLRFVRSSRALRIDGRDGRVIDPLRPPACRARPTCLAHDGRRRTRVAFGRASAPVQVSHRKARRPFLDRMIRIMRPLVSACHIRRTRDGPALTTTSKVVVGKENYNGAAHSLSDRPHDVSLSCRARALGALTFWYQTPLPLEPIHPIQPCILSSAFPPRLSCLRLRAHCLRARRRSRFTSKNSSTQATAPIRTSSPRRRNPLVKPPAVRCSARDISPVRRGPIRSMDRKISSPPAIRTR